MKGEVFDVKILADKSPSKLPTCYLLLNLTFFLKKKNFFLIQICLVVLVSLLGGFDGNTRVMGPQGYEILLRQTWCYVILHNTEAAAQQGCDQGIWRRSYMGLLMV